MKTIIIALVIGLVCMLIVLVSGLMSGVVRAGTIIYRTVFSFAFAGVSSYFFMMLYELYCELQSKKLSKAENTSGFQAMDVKGLPKVEK